GFSRTTARGYDAADNLVWEATPRKYDYDPTPADPTDLAAVRKISSDNATVTLNRYDGLNRKTHTTEAANAVGKLGHPPPETRWTYDKAGRIWVEEGPPVSGPTGMPSRQAIRYDHDNLDQVITVTEGTTLRENTDPVGTFFEIRRESIGYDGAGNVVSDI